MNTAPRPQVLVESLTAFAALILAAVALIVATGSSGAVWAHSGLGAASPAPGATVGGVVDNIQLRYASTVADPDGSVTDPNGVVLDTTFTQESNLKVTIALAEPLTVPGEYAVRHISTDVEDDDRVEAAYLFSYDPAAAPPQLEIVPDDDGQQLWVWIVLAVGIVVIAILGWRLARSLKRTRRSDASG